MFYSGDKVCLLNWDNNSKIYTIGVVYEHKLFYNGIYTRSTFIYTLEEYSFEKWFSKRDIRLATKEEVEKGHRIGKE